MQGKGSGLTLPISAAPILSTENFNPQVLSGLLWDLNNRVFFKPSNSFVATN